MGVTLERVQNKFACIIGELCSEPDILSEFAIWLDLRLAEYKSKGAISLECSGETPDPSWLRGHKGPPKRMKQRDSTPHSQRLHHYEPAQEYNDNFTQQDAPYERLSPEIVLLKEESKEIFPVSVHSHEHFSPSRNHARKRSATAPSSDSVDENNPYKIQKLSPSASHLEPVNQSLMSIINESGLDESAETSANISADFSHMNTPKGNNSSNPIPSTSMGESSDAQDGSNSVTDYAGQDVHARPRPTSGNETRSSQHRARVLKGVKARIVNIESKSNTTIGNLVGAVSKLENWLRKTQHETRNIEEIPPFELDSYLVVFFSILKNRHGCEYDPESFSNFRSFLDRFLKEQGYPASLSSSAVFGNSQAVYNDKRKTLTRIAAERHRARQEIYMLHMKAQMDASMTDSQSIEHLQNLVQLQDSNQPQNQEQPQDLSKNLSL